MEKKEKKKFKFPIRKELITSVLMMVIMFAIMFAFMPLQGLGQGAQPIVCFYAFGWHEQCDDSRYEYYAYTISNKKRLYAAF